MAGNLLRVALFGHGFLGKFHAQKVAQTGMAELSHIFESSPERAAQAQVLYPQAKVLLHNEIQSADFDAAIIALPTSAHFSLALQLIESGKHVFCEKPVTVTSKEAQLLERALKGKKQVFQVGQSERQHPLAQELKTSGLLSGAESQHLHLAIERVAVFKGRATDTDVVRDVMVHDLDLLLHLTKKIPELVKVSRFSSISSYPDHVVAWLEFPQGPRVSLTASRNHVEEKRLWTYASGQGVSELDFFRCQGRRAQGQELQSWTLEKKDHLLLEQIDFYRAILGHSTEGCSLSEAALAVTWCEKILDFQESDLP